MNGARRPIPAGLAGGMLGGALVGAVEALVAWHARAGGAAVPPIGWAVVVYGLVGGAAGVGAGVAAAVLGTDGFGLALGGVTAGLAFVVGRFRIVRDVFLEQAPHGLVPTLVQAGAAVALAALAIAAWRTLRGADARRGVLTRPGVVAAAIAVVGVIGRGLASLNGAPTTSPVVATAKPARGAPNVVLLMLDTVRADHIGWYGHREMHTPNIDRLGQDGTMFENMFSQASWTRASVATILTGLYPSSHGAIHKADVLPDRVDTLAEALARGGYYTAGFANNINVAPEFGFGQGFAEYHYLAPDLFFWADEAAAELTLYSGLRLVRERFFAHRVVVTNYYRPAEEVVDRAVEWLDGAGKTERPFFLFLHFMDAHDPYMVHPFNGVGYARVAMPNPPPAMADTLRETYDGCITYIDANLGRLFAELKQRRLYDSTMIVLTADHGEEFNEHGGWWHGTTLYDEQVRVPLIIKGAATGVGGRLVTEMTTSLDIAPTILAAARIPAPPAMQGHALPLGNEPAPARDSVFAEEDFEGNVLASERTTSWKLITANPGNPRGLAPEELYDMAGDPKETKNLADAEPTKREEMRAALGRGTLEARAQGGAGQQTNVDSVTKSRLKALGYAD